MKFRLLGPTLFGFWLIFSTSAAQPLDATLLRQKGERYLALAVQASLRSTLDSAVTYAGQALGVYEQLELSAEICASLNYKGKFLTSQGKITEAVPVLERSLHLSRRDLPQPDQHAAQALNNLGFCYGRLGRKEKALESLQEALAIRLEMFGELHPDVARTYFILSHFHGKEGNFELEGEYLQKVLAIYLQVDSVGRNDNPELEDAYNNLGVWYSRQGDYASAKDCYEKILQRMHHNLPPDSYRFAAVYNNLGNVYQRMGEFNKSLNYIRKALAINEKYFPETIKGAVNWANIGNVNMALGNLEEAREALEKAVQLDRGLVRQDEVGTAQSILKLAECLTLLKEYPAALDYLEEAEELFRRGNARGEIHLGRVYLARSKVMFRMGDAPAGMANFEQGIRRIIANDGKNHANVAEAYYLLARLLYEKGRYQEASTYAQTGLCNFLPDFNDPSPEALQTSGSIYSWHNVRKLSLIKAQCFFALSDTAATEMLLPAWDNIQLALQLTDSMRIHFSDDASRKFLGSTTFSGYELGMEISYALYQATGDTHYIDGALKVAEKSKAFLLSLALRDARLRQNGSIPDSLLKKERTLKTSLAKYDERLQRGVRNSALRHQWDSTRFALGLAYAALQQQLHRDYHELYASNSYTQSLSLLEIQAELAPDEALLEYFAGDTAIFLLYVNAGTASLHRMPRHPLLNAQFEALQQQLTRMPDPAAPPARTLHQFASPACQLYQKLLAPAFSAGIPARLTIVPDGPLSEIPYEVLLTSPAPPASSSYAELPYLFRQANLRYAYAARFLQAGASGASGKQQLLGLAPTFGRAAYAANRGHPGSLPHTTGEVEAVVGRMGGDALIGAAATEAHFKEKASQYRLLHLASHFVSNDSSPMASGILFTADSSGPEDGVLHIYELFDLPLNAELAVLSACNTGSGQQLRGEGRLSLAWGFRMAGCPALVVSLWNANDQAASGLMSDFYEALDAGQHKDAALNQARSRYLAAADNFRAHPYFWAQFVLLGNDAPLQAAHRKGWWLAWFGIAALAMGSMWLLKRGRKA